MKRVNGGIVSSATDLANYMGCKHAVVLDKKSVLEEIDKPFYHNPTLEALKERGRQHEQQYLEHLKARGKQGICLQRHPERSEGSRTMAVPPATRFFAALRMTTVDPRHPDPHDRHPEPKAKDLEPPDPQTLKEALQAAPDYIYQAPLNKDTWRGIADFLIKVEDKPSNLGNYSYEVLDAKLARETRGETILQLCVYSEILAELQGAWPEYAYVLTPDSLEPEPYRLPEYAAYYRLVKKNYAGFVDNAEDAGTYPDPVEKCDRCDWYARCEQQWRDDDHLTFVAGISRSQRAELAEHGVTTLAELARLPVPLNFKPNRGAAESLERIREQARIQFEAREAEERKYELLPREAGQGLFLLPAPSAGDVYFDIEGARFVGDEGLEYLFGFATFDDAGNLVYEKLIANTPNEEKQRFDAFMQRMDEIQQAHPDMHIYHFHSYEPSALKRLACRYAMHEDLLDDMLRHERFVDLHRVVKQTVRASVERYSIKDLEPFFGYAREMDLRTAGDARHDLESWLEFDNPLNEAPAKQVQIVIDYNKDDCLATHGLHQWLESIRDEVQGNGEEIPRYVADPEVSEELTERLQRLRDLGNQLREGLPDDEADHSEDDRARWLLSHLLEFYRREDKSTYWEKFRLSELDDIDRLSERSAIAGLQYLETVDKSKTGIPTDRYKFPTQDITIKAGDALYIDSESKLGTVAAIDHEHQTVDIKKMGKTKDLAPTSVFTWRLVGSPEQEASLVRLAEKVLTGDTDTLEMQQLRRSLPVLTTGQSLEEVRGEMADEQALALHAITRIENQILGIQGPPGTGKTHTGAQMMLEAVRAGMKVGVTGPSHKVIINLLHQAIAFARNEGLELRIVRKTGNDDDDEASAADPMIEALKDNDAVEAAIRGDAQIAAGTAWLWAREHMMNTVDILFIDEAGQFSLANTCAVAQAANAMVLLGDPQQLDQPLKGTHPPGVQASGLQHMLGKNTTMPKERGLFLPASWRMHPNVCEYISEMFYLDRLSPAEGRENQALLHDDFPERAGLWFMPVAHEGNQNSSVEEAKTVASLHAQLLADGRWHDHQGTAHDFTSDDILVVTPYNAQLGEIKKQNHAINVGTVDKFQGQQAPVVIISYATSTPEEAPRGMDFLYSLNRLNVAVSRARCAVFLVCAPALINPECKMPHHMKLANGLCRYAELSYSEKKLGAR